MESETNPASWLTSPIEEGEAFWRLQGSAAPAAPAATSAPRTCRRRRHAFYVGMAVAFLVTVFVGFAPSYFLRGLSHSQPLNPLVHVHGMVFTSWLVLLLVQTTLVAARRVKLHRRLGIGGTVLAAIMVPLGLVTAIEAGRRGLATPDLDAIQLMIFPMGSIVMFAGFMTAAILKRRQPEYHRRLILLATVSIITPAIARMGFVGMRPVVALLLSLLFVVAGMIYDRRTRGSVHRIYLVGALIIFMSGPVRYGVGHTDAWRGMANFMMGTEASAELEVSPDEATAAEESEQVDWRDLRDQSVEVVAMQAAGL